MRESHAESAIPTGVDSPVYLDARQIARALGRHMSESYLAQGTGAGGAGFTVSNVPFEPAYIKAVNPAGAAPAIHESFFTSTPAHVSVTDTGAGTTDIAVNATPPTLTQVGANDWTVTVPVGMAPDGEVLTLLIEGVREGNGSL